MKSLPLPRYVLLFMVLCTFSVTAKALTDPELTASRDGTGVRANWQGLSTHVYALQYSYDLISWSPFYVTLGTDSVQSHFEASHTLPVFYRIQYEEEPFLSMDSDNDGLPDGWELQNSIDPLDNGTISYHNGPRGDPTSTGVTNWERFTQSAIPSTPSSLSINISNRGYVALTWDDNSDKETQYLIQYSSDLGETWNDLSIVDSSALASPISSNVSGYPWVSLLFSVRAEAGSHSGVALEMQPAEAVVPKLSPFAYRIKDLGSETTPIRVSENGKVFALGASDEIMATDAQTGLLEDTGFVNDSDFIAYDIDENGIIFGKEPSSGAAWIQKTSGSYNIVIKPTDNDFTNAIQCIGSNGTAYGVRNLGGYTGSYTVDGLGNVTFTWGGEFDGADKMLRVIDYNENGDLLCFGQNSFSQFGNYRYFNGLILGPVNYASGMNDARNVVYPSGSVSYYAQGEIPGSVGFPDPRISNAHDPYAQIAISGTKICLGHLEYDTGLALYEQYFDANNTLDIDSIVDDTTYTNITAYDISKNGRYIVATANKSGLGVRTILLYYHNVDSVEELDNSANIAPNPKNPSVYDNGTSTQSPVSVPANTNTLFVAADPSSGKVELKVKSKTSAGSPQTLVGIKNPDGTLLPESGSFDENGEAILIFTPTLSSFPEDNVLKLVIGDDANSNGALESTEAFDTPIDVVAISSLDIFAQELTLRGGIYLKGGDVTKAFFDYFLSDNNTIFGISHSTETFDSDTSSITHIAGSIYSNYLTDIPLFVFPDGNVLSDTLENDAAHPYTSAGLGTVVFDVWISQQSAFKSFFQNNTGVNEHTFDPVSVQRVEFFIGENKDLNTSLGNAFVDVQVQFTLKRDTGNPNLILAESMSISGQVVDVFDFDFTRGVKAESRRAATVQIGYESPSRESGKIFKIEVQVNQTYGATEKPITLFNSNSPINL